MKAWTADFIEDAATQRVDVRGTDGRLWTGNSNYAPLARSGIHLCGQTDDGEQPTTIANYPMRDRAEAERAWQLARVAECPFEEADFIVDIVVDGDVPDGFPSNRQLWPRAIEAWNAGAVAA